MSATSETQRLLTDTQRLRALSEKDESNLDRFSSLYGGVFLVFLTMLVAHGYQCWGLAQQSKQLREMETSLSQVVPQYDLIDQKLSFVSEDLLKLAKSSPAAERIVKEFNIRQNSTASIPPSSNEK